MTKSKVLLFSVFLFIMTACESLQNYVPNPLADSSIPVAIQETIASRVNPEKELYVLSSASIAKSGSMLAQANANKNASAILKDKIRQEVVDLFKSYTSEMDAFSGKIIDSSASDLIEYSADLAMKKITQKGAWEDNNKIYTLLTIDRSDIRGIADKVFKKFINERTKEFSKIAK